MNNNCLLWVLIILLILGISGNVFSCSTFAGCGIPVLIALLYCLHKNGTLASWFNCCGCGHNCGCGCNG